MGKSDVDDAVLFLARFAKGAVASFEATRLATGNQNRNKIEINGEKGSVRFDFEDMNYLDFYDATQPRKQQGWTRIMVTHGGDHPYVGNWWPDAHIIDMARFITGDEVTEVIGSVAETFIKERKIVESGPKGGIAGGTAGGGQMGKSDVDDAVLFLARFGKGAIASFEATRLATGNQNRNKIEINGDKGSVRFDF